LLWSILINSLQPGQGITIGNQLRRVLLGDLGGIAISAVRIAGVTHEFSTIPGVREDILEILLNLKGIVVKNKTQDIEFGRLKVQGPSVITADLIQLPSNLEIVNQIIILQQFLPQTFLKLNLSLNMVLVIG
jgi:DNA-directed RNA polymerase subunit alpha